MNEPLLEKLRYLHLNRLAAHWEDDLKEAARQRLPGAGLWREPVPGAGHEEGGAKPDVARYP